MRMPAGSWGGGVESSGDCLRQGPRGSRVWGQSVSKLSTLRPRTPVRGGARSRSRAVLDGICPSCTSRFDTWSASGPLKTYCSARCRTVALRRRRLVECASPSCGLLVQLPRSTCREHRPSRALRFHGPAEVICRQCGRDMAPADQRTGGGRLTQHYCSFACRFQAAGQRHPDRQGRGAGRRFPRVRGRARVAILERDGWICQLCRAPIRHELTFPHPGSASIDHRDPFGGHDPANWQASHLACNVAKGQKLGRVAA